MDEKEILKTIKRMIEDIIERELIVDSGLLDEGILDSLLTVELLNRIEDTFQIVVDTDELTHFNFNSIGAVCNLVLKKIETTR